MLRFAQHDNWRLSKVSGGMFYNLQHRSVLKHSQCCLNIVVQNAVAIEMRDVFADEPVCRLDAFARLHDCAFLWMDMSEIDALRRSHQFDRDDRLDVVENLPCLERADGTHAIV